MDKQKASTSSKSQKLTNESNMDSEDQLEESIIDADPEVQKIWNQLCMALNSTVSEEDSFNANNDTDGSINGSGNRRRKQMTCNGCGLFRSHCAHGFCGSCYIREKIKAGVWKEENQRTCVNCNEMKRHYARGLCRNCYQRVVSRPQQKMKEHGQKYPEVCLKCGEIRMLQCKNMCQNCYQRTLARQKQKSEEFLKNCNICGKLKRHFSKGSCESCYKTGKSEDYKNGILRVCTECGEIKRHHCGGMCQNCYKRSKIQPNEESNLKICEDCGQLKKHEANGNCTACYQRNSVRSKQIENADKNMRVCTFCLQLKKTFCKEVCQQCYYLKFKKKIKSPFIKNDESQSPCSSRSIQSEEPQNSTKNNNNVQPENEDVINDSN